ncbi:MlaD family protein [Pontibacter chinhatensis]|uniref:Phospholipid/cholesterol/gamma-HCH transport system substrate-binding protein n=1 Tax=Pontibacter chinhatensis TaxID=1436961 RepID=A0A1I2V9M2_9BACT|nr:MlaD family protein [Pontibacter chinhatensis]SFG84887.1 phospholipid/cholesterol/gamma-HCH transport system substrate-binding protein [Pontibacter chinhatensis]
MKISKETKVALLGIVALVLLYFGFMYLKGSDIFSDTHRYFVIYDNVDGLNVSNPVILNGVQVGSVRKLRLMTDNQNKVQVELEVMQDLQVGDSTIAALGSSDILGSKAITLYLGNSTTTYKGGETLIPFTQSSITEMISTKTVPIIDKVDTTLARVNRLLDAETKGNIQEILENTNKSTAALYEMLNANQNNINQITRNVSELTTALKQTQRNLNHLSSNMVEITDTLKQVEIIKLVDNANLAVTELQSAVAKLNSPDGSLGKLMHDEQLYENMNRSTEALNLLLRDIQAYPKRYVSFSVFGRKDKYKVDETGRVITLEEVKELQDRHPQEFRTVPDTVYVPVPETSTGKGATGADSIRD